MTDSFSHDANASSDIKMQRLVRKYGMEGVGVYWTIYEALYREEGMISLERIPDIAFSMHVVEDLVKDLIMTSGLFSFDENTFWSDGLLEEMKERDARGKRFNKRAKKAASRRWEQTQEDNASGVVNATSIQQACLKDANSMLEGCLVDANSMQEACNKHCTSNATSILEKEERTPPPLSPPLSPSDSLFPPPYNPPSKKEEKELSPLSSPKGEADVKKVGDKKQPIPLDSLLLLKVPEGYREAFREFLAFRKQVHKAMTPNAVDLAVKKLDRELQTDEQRQECLRMSILNGWQGVFPDAVLRKRDGPKSKSDGSFGQRTKTGFDYWGDTPEEALDGLQSG